MQRSAMSIWAFVRACVVALVLCVPQLVAQPGPLITLEPGSVHPVASNFLLWVDKSRHLTIHDILRLDQEHRFQAAPQDLNAGYSDDAYWFKLVVANPTPLNDWYLVAESPDMHLTGFRQGPEPGSVMPLEEPADQNRATRRLTLPPGSTATFFFRANSAHIIDLKFNILDGRQLAHRNQNEAIFIAIVIGCYIALILYNFFLYLSLRDRNYLFYLLFALANSHLNLLAVHFPRGIDTWLGVDWLQILAVYQPWAPLTTFLFARSFLQTGIQFPRLDKVMIGYMGLLVALMVSAFILPKNWVLTAELPVFFMGVFLLLFAGFYALARGFKPAAYFLSGVGMFLLGIFIYLSKSSGFIPSNLLTTNAHLAGHAAEMLLMSLALGRKIKLLEIAKARAEIVAQVKTRLLRIISHDMATPLTVVKATAFHLAREPALQNRVERITRAVGMIEDITAFVRKTEMIEANGKFDLHPVLLKEVFNDLAFLFQDKAHEKNLELHFELPRPDLAVLAETVSLCNEVLANLLSNAIKFSFPGSAILIRAEEIRDRVVLTIRDRGIGMDAVTVATLFEPTTKFSRQGTQGEKGIGFGMPLAKAYVDAYGATIEAESIPRDTDPERCGTTIRITLAAAVLPVRSLESCGNG